MLTLPLVVRVGVLLSLLCTFASGFVEGGICYTCVPDTTIYVSLVHVLLFVATFINSKPMMMLVITILVFYASRIWVLQLDPSSYVYDLTTPTAAEMVGVVLALLIIAGSMVAGCATGALIAGQPRGGEALEILPRSRHVDVRAYYYTVVWMFIASRLLRLYLLAMAGVGLPLDRNLFEINLLILQKGADIIAFFGWAPIAWLILKKPRGFERRLTWFAIALFAIVQSSSLSRVSLLTTIIPFVLVYYAAGMRIPPRLVKIGTITFVVVAIVAISAVTEMRATVAEAFAGEAVQLRGASVDLVANLSAFASRVGSSFDVLSFVVTNPGIFDAYLNFGDELKDVVNNFMPGGILEADPPRWTELLYAKGHGADYQLQLRLQHGENITMPGHLYVNFGLTLTAIVSFVVMFVYAFLYHRSNTLLLKVFLLWSIWLDISNGSGVLTMVVALGVFVLAFAMARTASRMFGRVGRPLRHSVASPR